MKLIIYVNRNIEEERALFDLDEKRVLLYGDCYHNNIDYRIDGYLEALVDFGIYTNNVDTELIDKSHEHYKLVYFQG